MKVTIQVDCTPDEARQFFGLPDVKPMQAAVMQKLQQQTLDAVASFSPDALLKSWLSFGAQVPEQFQKAMAGMMPPFGTGGGQKP